MSPKPCKPRHRYVGKEKPDGVYVRCRRCGFSWVQLRLFPVAA